MKNSLIMKLEERLRNAMCESNVDELDTLLSSDLVFTNHLGQVMSKKDDLDAHRKKLLKIDSLVLSETKIMELPASFVVCTKAEIKGNYAGQPADGVFRFTRVWANISNNWQVVAGHSCLAA